jgi:hypothetical protein
MSISYRRYEILLPQRYNDGRPIPTGLIRETAFELRERFGACSCESQTIQGQWRHEGRVYHDDLVRIFVDVPDTAENRRFLYEMKEKLKVRFEQIDLWITSHPLDVL